MTDLPDNVLSLELDQSIWDRFFSVASLAIVGTRSKDGSYELFTTHCGLPLAPANLFAFLASPAEAAVRNCYREHAFTVSFPRPDQVVESSLAVTKNGIGHPLSSGIPTFTAAQVDGVLVVGGQVFLECQVDRIIDDLGGGALVVGRIVAAHVDREARRLAERDDYDLLAARPLLAFVAPGRYATIAHTDAFPDVEQ